MDVNINWLETHLFNETSLETHSGKYLRREIRDAVLHRETDMSNTV